MTALTNLLKKTIRRILRIDRRGHVLRLIKKGDICAEVGVWKGAFSRQILGRKPGSLHLVDPWLYIPEFGDRSYGAREGSNQSTMDTIYENTKRLFQNNSKVVIHRKTSEEAGSEFTDQYFDFVYIDANHNYEYVKQDLLLYLQKTKNGGLPNRRRLYI